ncbi:ly6/PLAUR domain-containing protein 8 [Acomys russatus]|uniref:ly6/PLAUR domain-containing protein 8 n=1 Tax=Acomys russatus TaxID=60746 RepID=UPI0021E1D16C|nr:ly6/PLAUR domain-containing protein 8 [Acomys russatus]
MKGILIAAVLVAFATTAVDSLRCEQCHKTNSTCVANVTECPAGSLSCVVSSINTTLGGIFNLYQNKFCSADNCSESNTEVAFNVHMFDDQRFHFASQCCQGKECNNTSHASGTQTPTNTLCASCYSYNSTACVERSQQCYQGEQCVHVTAENANGTLELKGCSDISSSTCQFLSTENTTVGEFIFRKVVCSPAIILSTLPASTSTPTTSMGTKASFTFSVFGSLLLLKLLF